MKKITVLDLFSGIGGFHKGFEKAGYKVKTFFSEVDAHAIAVYKYNFKNSKYVGSVTDVQGSELPRINAITFGSPCQDFSLAGKRKGMGGEKSSLILEAIRLIKECRPDFFIWENVKGTFSSNNRQDFAAILQAFANIGGYRIEWQLLNTKWFLPQNRERVYLVGYAPGKSRGQVFPIGESLRQTDSIQRQYTNTITAKRRDGQGSYVIESKQHAQVKTNGNTNTLSSVQKDNYVVTGGLQKNAAVMTNETPAMGMGGGHTPIVNKIRRLTPIECERLQGFPDNWTQEGVNGPISDTQRYKMCGNAVTVDVVEAVGKQILKL